MHENHSTRPSCQITWWPVDHGPGTITKEGSFPDGVCQSDLIEILKGDMGGRFQMFIPAGPNAPGRFRYIAYTSDFGGFWSG